MWRASDRPFTVARAPEPLNYVEFCLSGRVCLSLPGHVSRLLPALAAATLLFVQTPALKAEPSARICFGALTVKKLGKKARIRTHQKVIKELTALGVEIPQETHGMLIERDCLVDPSCVVWALEDVQVDGVLVVRATRAKRKAKVTVLFYDGKTGNKVFEETFKSRKKRFPRRAPFGAVLARGLEALKNPPQPDPTPASSSDTTEVVASADPMPAAPMAPPVPDPTPAAAHDGDSSGSGTGTLLKAVGWGSAGLGAVSMVGGSVTGVLALQLDQSLKAKCDQTTMTCDYDVADEYDQMRTLALSTDILLGAGVAVALFGAGTLVFAALDGGQE